MFVSRGRDPPRRRRRVLRVGRAARRSASARPARDRRRRGRARRQLRGEGVRHPHGDGRQAGAPAVPAGDRGRAADVGVLRGEQGHVRGVRAGDAARRGALDRRGVSRRARDAPACGPARRTSPCGCGADVREQVGLPITVGVARTKFLAKVASGVAKPDGAARRTAGRRARTSCIRSRSNDSGVSVASQPTSFTNAGSRRSARSPSSRETTLVAMLGRASGRQLHALAHNRDPRPVQVGRRRRSIGSQRALGRTEIAGGARRDPDRDRRPCRAAAAGRPARLPHRRAPAALRRLLASDPVAHAAAGDRADAGDPRHGEVAAGGAMPLIERQGITLVGLAARQSRRRRRRPARAAVRPSPHVGTRRRARRDP